MEALVVIMYAFPTTLQYARSQEMKERKQGMVWYGMIWYGTAWYGTAWHGMVVSE